MAPEGTLVAVGNRAERILGRLVGFPGFAKVGLESFLR
jgi:hypothetical protein